MARKRLSHTLNESRVLDAEPLLHKALTLGLNLSDLAAKTITGHRQIHRILTGSVRRPDALIIARICEVLGVDAGSVWVHPATLAAREHCRHVMTPARIRARADRWTERQSRRIWPGRHAPPGKKLL